MTLEDLHALAAAGPRQSKPFKKRLLLLQPILTHLPESATNAFNKTERFYQQVWTDILTPCIAMEMANWRFDLLHNAHDGLVRDILVGLDKIVQVPEFDIPEELKETQLPRIEALARAIGEANKTDTYLIELVQPDNADELIESLNSLAKIMADNESPEYIA
ncbi:uncharacterized protein TrAtP1_002474 [Trichoderma atroviride]|uniref:Uncharacterized protein n=1 Tax=Hypocrea atroviridis (strain ATCC 20476 / IMI 206040) TaxID=452589 RepID=G9P1F5_HYPAI|nr:uncharacterized protein TRIATDRAFT_310104 [Trichoderma atroviride IMI 206040]EHK42508.1 hypothetical protein TRIATDRAFT_310104 [Trichoderma atroviride IMI 206040]UKZ61206.1 hypothetical protein TrAtP1_002474 [Trichoderma atroviride]